MKKIIVLVLIAVYGQLSYGQSKTFDLMEIMTNFDLYPASLDQLKWLPSTNQFSYVDESDNLKIGSVNEESTSNFMSLNELNDLLPDSLSLLSSFPSHTWKSSSTFSFRMKGKVWSYKKSADSLRLRSVYDPSGQNVDVAKNYNVAFTKGGNIYVTNAKHKSYRALTDDGGTEIVYGEAAHRSEFGIVKGTFWSPSGTKLAFYRIDQSKVSDYPLADYSQIPASLKSIKYPMNGDESQNVSIGVYDINTNKMVFLKTGEPTDQYLTNITWSPGGNYVFVAVLNRGQDTMKLNQYDARSGIFIKTLFTETDKEYVEPENGPMFFKKDIEKFLWMSERDGFDHLYLYDTDGNMLKQLTQGDWKVTEFLGFDLGEKNIYITTTKKTVLERHPYSVNIKEGTMKRISSFAGYHRSQLSFDGKYLLDSYTRVDNAGFVKILDIKKGEKVRTLFKAPNPLEEYNLGEVSLFSIAGEDGDSLHCRLIKPVDFNEFKKYPVIIYLYGGPHLQIVRNSWNGGAQYFLQYLAQQGYAVFSLDNRGSAHRGIEFEQAVFRQLGTLETEDQMRGVNWLKKQKWVDKERMGVFGWSYGGFMATSLKLRKPGVFKVAVAGGPVTDWRMYEIMYGERYMDRITENPEGFEMSKLSNYLEDLEGKLLFIHGLQDNVVLPQHSLNFLRRSVELGKQVDFYPYSAHPHNVRGSDRAHLMQKISQYFMENL